MKWFTIILIVLISGCYSKKEKHIEYYSVEKSYYNNSFGILDDNFNFYKFQRYYQSVRVDSVYLEHYHQNFENIQIFNFLKNKYKNKGYDHCINLLSRIGQLNAENFNDTSIIVIDINDSISLINLSPEFAIYAMGSCCSNYQNLILKKRNNSIIFTECEDEIMPGKLLGVYLEENGKISSILIQGFSNNHYDFYGLNSTYNVKYDITEKGIIPVGIINVRNGEPFDKNDTDSLGLKENGMNSYYFDYRH